MFERRFFWARHLAARIWRVSVAGLFVAAGCGPPKTPYPAALNSERPDERVLAIRHAAETHDTSVVPLLVDRLEDEDEAVRFFAILALERLTGTRLGYDYRAPEEQRWRAVQNWRRHLARSERSARGADKEGKSGTGPANVGPDAVSPASATGGADL